MAEIKEEKKYTKVLVSRFSPQNGCNVDDGELLVVKPKNNITLKDYVPHFFVGINNSKAKSKYGWVKEVPQFTINDFVSNIKQENISVMELQCLTKLFDCIVNLQEGTPVAASYNQKSMTEKEMELKVHKVFFHKK